MTVGTGSRYDLEMVTGKRLRGHVFDAANGQPVGRARVFAMVSSRPDSPTRVGRSGKTNDEGEFELFVPPGICTVRTWALDRRQPHNDQERTIEIPDVGDVSPVVLLLGPLQPERAGRIQVGQAVVREAPAKANPQPPPVRYKLTVQLRTNSKQPIGGHSARLVFRGKSVASEWSSHNDARFSKTFPEADTGKVGWLLIDVPGFRPVKSPEFTVGPDMPPLVIDLEPSTYVPMKGKVEGPDGKPIKGARVRMRHIIYGTQTVFPWGVEVSTDAMGQYEFKHIRVGEQLMVHVEHEGFRAEESGPVFVDDSEPIEIPTLSLKESKNEPK